MRLLGRLFGLCLILLFLVVWPCSMWTFNVQRIALDVDTYKNAFHDENFYANLVPGVLPALLEGLDTSGTDPHQITFLKAINSLDEAEWNRIAANLVPREWVQYEVETNLDAFLSWLEGHRNDLSLVFHTDALSRRLSDSPGEAAVDSMVAAMHPCTPAEELQFRQYVNGATDVEFPYCKPQNSDLLDKLPPLLNAARREAVVTLPTELNVIQEIEQAAETHTADQPGPHGKVFTPTQLNQFRSGVRLWRNLLLLNLLIPAALLSLVVIVTIRSSKSFFRWMGWTLILSGLLTLVPLVFLPFMAQEFHFESELQAGFASGGELIAEVVSQRLVRLLVGQFTWPILIQTAAMIVIGFLFEVLSVLLNDPDAPPDDIPAYQTTITADRSL